MSTRGYFSQFDADDRPTRTWSGKMQQPNVPVRVLWRRAVLVCEGLPDGTYSESDDAASVYLALTEQCVWALGNIASDSPVLCKRSSAQSYSVC